MSERGAIAACLKWVDDHPDVDALTGAVHTDWRTSGASAADAAALEWALRLGERWHRPVVAVTAGPVGADALVRDALAVGATAGVRADLVPGAASDEVAAALAAVLPRPVDLVLCGVWSLDRGSGSVPAFLAAELDAVQALGLVTLEPEDGQRAASLRGERRLDGGRRERVRIRLPAVCSVAGASARLRRATFDAVVAGRGATVAVAPVGRRRHDPPVRTGPFRPRAKELPAPSSALSARERILELTGSLGDREPPQTLVLDPPAAADELLARLRSWGYLP